MKRYVEANIKCLIKELPWKIFRKEDVTFQQIHALMSRRGGVETQRLLREAKKAVENGTASFDQVNRVLSHQEGSSRDDVSIDKQSNVKLAVVHSHSYIIINLHLRQSGMDSLPRLSDTAMSMESGHLHVKKHVASGYMISVNLERNL